jgi:hypothetical protein
MGSERMIATMIKWVARVYVEKREKERRKRLVTSEFKRLYGHEPQANANEDASNPSSMSDSDSPRPTFIPSDTFSGSRPGYVFKLGEVGPGYYLDKSAAAAETMPVKPVSVPFSAADPAGEL